MSAIFLRRKSDEMIEIFYTNGQQEFQVQYDSYNEFERAQFSCLTQIADHYKVTKVLYNGHLLDYHDVMGNLYFFLSKLDHSQYQ